MEKTFKIGLISKPQGINGEVKVYPLTDDIKRFSSLKQAVIGGTTVKIEKTRICGDFAVLKIFGISDRNAAETLRNKYIEVDRENAVKLEEGRYFIADLIGMSVFSDETLLGKITDFTEAKTPYITATDLNGKVFRFPFLKDALIIVDVEKGEMHLKSQRLKEIILYED